MAPTTPPPSAPPVPGSGFVELVRTRRQDVAYVLLAAATALLVLAVWMGYKAMKPGAGTDTPAAELNPLDPKPVEIANPKRGDYLVGGLAVLSGFLAAATAGVVLLVSLPNPSVEKQRADVRLAILAVGGVVGIVLILAGLAFFYRWSDSLTAWLDKDRSEAKQAWKVLVPLLMIALGAGATFLAILPARADERNSVALRRTVYGANLGLTVLLLLTVLVIGNVVVSGRVPNKLDVTEAAITTLSPTATQLVAGMAEPVTIYHIGQEGERLTADTRMLLDRMAEVNRAKLKVVAVSPTADKAKLKELVSKYAALTSQGVGNLGVLLTTGPDEKRHAFVREQELATEEQTEDGPRGGRKFVFQGEAKIVRELAFLAEGGTKPIVYAVQGFRELSLGGGRAVQENRSMSMLKTYLERSNLDVRPLTFDPAAPVIPADAGLILIADPPAAYPPPVVQALEKYMTEPRAGGAKGKLLLFVGANAGPDRKITKTGLEPLLERFGVNLRDRMIMSYQTPQYDWEMVLPVPTDAALLARNPIAALFARRVAPWDFCRPVAAVPAPQGGPFQTMPLFETVAERPTWVEESVPADLGRILADLKANPEVRRRKEFTGQERSVAVLVTETPPPAGGPSAPVPVPRLAVFGSGEFVSDAFSRQLGGVTNPNIELIAATADWLRERPAIGVGVESKTYAQYKLNPAADDTRLVLLPLGLALLIVIGLGAGVWVIRRS